MSEEQRAKLRGPRTPEQCARIRAAARQRDTRGAKNPNWKGGRVLRSDGRSLVYAPGHPGAIYGGSHILEYRLIAEKKVGRPLRDFEVVHHVDGNVRNNDLDNLEVITQAEHARSHSPNRRRAATGTYS
jgi:hypothetical protein